MASIPSWPNLAKGNTGTNIKALQCLLNYRNNNTALAVDGSFGPSVYNAVVAFQKSKGRLAHHLSQSEFAELLEISDSTLASLERGSRKPSYDMLINIIKKLKVSADEALGLDGYLQQELEISALSKSLEALDDRHKKYALKNIELMIHFFQTPDM